MDSLGDAQFSAAVDLVLNTQTYLIVVGVGKSGHVGQKIAASFASTGTPAFFLHPTEASHGDLGMIQPGCSVLAISSSGASKELKDVLQYTKKIGVPIIGITRREQSILGRASQIILKLPDSGEACPNGLAPTTSTTNTLCIGDALMVAVMNERGFSREDFGARHPGGSLGLQLQTVDDWLDGRADKMTQLPMDADMKAVIMAVSESGTGSTAIVGPKGELKGIITDGDLRRSMDDAFFTKSAKDIMTADPLSLTRDMKIGDVITLLSEKRMGGAYILDGAKPIGIIDMKTLLAEGYI